MNDVDNLFGKKHATLWRISMWANGLAPILLLIFVLAGFGQISQYNTIANTQYQTDLIGLFSQHPIYILDLILQIARVSLQGCVYYLVLKCIALGLDMIVETDLNHRENKTEEGAE